MAVSFKRKLYGRGGSYETTIPIQMLFSLDLSKKYDVVFEFDAKLNKWVVDFERFEEDSRQVASKIKKNKKSHK